MASELEVDVSCIEVAARDDFKGIDQVMLGRIVSAVRSAYLSGWSRGVNSAHRTVMRALEEKESEMRTDRT